MRGSHVIQIILATDDGMVAGEELESAVRNRNFEVRRRELVGKRFPLVFDIRMLGSEAVIRVRLAVLEDT